jgi:5'-nucleotidase
MIREAGISSPPPPRLPDTALHAKEAALTNWNRVVLSAAWVVAALAGGCAHKKKAEAKVPLEPGVTDVGTKAAPASAVPPDPSFVSVPAGASQPKFVPVDVPAATPAAAAQPAPAVQAAAPAAPVMLSQTPAPTAPPPAPGAGRQYRVQKGDTLFGIAKAQYGNGNRWQQIASANPGLTPASLKAGSTIVVP